MSSKKEGCSKSAWGGVGVGMFPYIWEERLYGKVVVSLRQVSSKHPFLPTSSHKTEVFING